MSAITGTGDSTTMVFRASTSLSRGTATRTRSAPASDQRVYAPARGARARWASGAAARARARRHARFFALTGARPDSRIVDIGCGALGLRALEPDRDITGVDLVPRPDYPGPFVQADVLEGLPFEDGAFDLAYSSSVIEHVPPDRREAFAAELRRVARGFYVQTPAFSVPIEPHTLLPCAHWMPPALRRPYWRLGVAGGYEGIPRPPAGMSR